jgi:polyisoprenoid-binding protein YceI
MKKLLLLPFLLVGCAQNPADNKPAAQVSSATPTTANSTPIANGVRYALDAKSSKIEFVGSKVTGSHSGGFGNFTGEVVVADKKAEKGQVQVEIQMDSVTSDDPKLTGHLKGKDFFEVETYPTASFRSTSIAPEGEGYKLSGDFTLHGVTKSISFPANITVADDKVAAKAEFSINRNDFGIVYKGKADNLIRPEVVIKLDLNLAKQP